VDGFHLYNGALSPAACLSPCNSYGVQCVLEHLHILVAEQTPWSWEEVHRGASRGAHAAAERRHGEHLHSRGTSRSLILADILVVATGKPQMITAPMVKGGGNRRRHQSPARWMTSSLLKFR
jgi:methylenetetrahydrofolate dehydrogenase (NADP+)/methenyltetrahydrofolate cyclohydrolase